VISLNAHLKIAVCPVGMLGRLSVLILVKLLKTDLIGEKISRI